MGSDPYKTTLRPDGGYTRGAAVTTSDVTELTNYCDALYIGGAGDVNVMTLDGDTILFKAVPVGTTLKVRAKLVLATNTTATNIVALS